MVISPSSRLLGATWVALALGFMAAPALADCTDPHGPDVDWQRCYQDGRNLAGADLRRAKLRDARFTRGDLSGANFTGADGRRAKFVTTVAKGAIFDEAYLTEADLTKADLTGASLRKTDLRRAKLFRAILREADLSGARLGGADLLKADLSGALWTDGKTICAEDSIGQCK